LRDAIVTYPDHPLIAAAYLELGNLEAHEGHWKEAIGWYERMLRESVTFCPERLGFALEGASP
jgi:hypothetical protein